MFTGIIQEIGKIEAVTDRGGSLRLKIKSAAVGAGAKLGDSISVSGVCLTVSAQGTGWVEMDVGEETYRRTKLSGLRAGDAVNLEPALRAGDAIGGHFVTGHVDAVASVRSVSRQVTQIEMCFKLPRELRPLVAQKGSIAIDGISLTVGCVDESSFSVYLIPHTVENTTLRRLTPGDKVNIEADVLARYVHNVLRFPGDEKAGGMKKLLGDFGYLKKE